MYVWFIIFFNSCYFELLSPWKSIPCDLSSKRCSQEPSWTNQAEHLSDTFYNRNQFFQTEQMDLSFVSVVAVGVLTLWTYAGAARSLDCCLKSSKTVEMFPLPQSPAEFTLISYESRLRESVTFPVTLGCLQPIGRQQIYFYLSGPIAWQCGSAHCLVTVTNMLIRESQMMDGSVPESGLSF